MSRTTADKLNYLKDTKELLRQELNNDFSDLNLTASDPFRQYPSRISSSQLWMDAWIGGSVELDVTYDGTGELPPIFRNRYFNTLSMPNIISELSYITANTVIFGGPSSANNSLVSSTYNKIETLYVNDLKTMLLNNMFSKTVISGIRNLYLPSVASIGGTKGSFGKSIYALDSNSNIYLPKVTEMYEFSIRGSNLHIGNTECTLHNNAFDSIGSIYVPASKVDWYKSAPNWSRYANKIFAEPGT